MIIIKDNVLYTLSSFFLSVSYVPLIPSTFQTKIEYMMVIGYVENFGHNQYQILWVWFYSFYTTSAVLCCVV